MKGTDWAGECASWQLINPAFVLRISENDRIEQIHHQVVFPPARIGAPGTGDRGCGPGVHSEPNSRDKGGRWQSGEALKTRLIACTPIHQAGSAPLPFPTDYQSPGFLQTLGRLHLWIWFAELENWELRAAL